jgi:hypothetical protein
MEGTSDLEGARPAALAALSHFGIPKIKKRGNHPRESLLRALQWGRQGGLVPRARAGLGVGRGDCALFSGHTGKAQGSQGSKGTSSAPCLRAKGLVAGWARVGWEEGRFGEPTGFHPIKSLVLPRLLGSWRVGRGLVRGPGAWRSLCR